jgi:hypothetical protein
LRGGHVSDAPSRLAASRFGRASAPPAGFKISPPAVGAGPRVHGTGVLVPYGTTSTTATFVSSAIDLEKVIFNPTFNQALTSFQFK